MDFEESSLYREVRAIVGGTVNPVHYLWTAEIHIGAQTYAALKVLSVDMVVDYESAYSDVVIVELAILAGTYAKQIYPNQSNLELTLTRQPLYEVADQANTDLSPQAERYTATLIDAGNPMLEGNASNNLTEEALNKTNIFQIQFQLVNKALEQLRMVTVGGTYRNTTAEDVIRTVLTRESQKLAVDGQRVPKGVDMVPADNTGKRDHIVIPQSVMLVDLPAYIHAKCGGIYSSGMGYYLQGDYWYLYPCYDLTRFTKAQRTLTVINVPKNKFPNVERTYRQSGRNTMILATGEVKFKDDTDSWQLNEGNGVRFADATKFMEGFSTTEANVTTMSRGANVSEFVSQQRPNGNNNVRTSKRPITANPFVEYSQLARRQGSFLSLIWENSDTALIFPGMPVKVLYLVEDEIQEVVGVMLKAHHRVALRGQGMTASRHSITTALSIFVQRNTQAP